MKQFSIFLLLASVLSTCIGPTSKPWKSIDLKAYGIPAVVLTPPDSTSVENFELAGVKDVSITSTGSTPYAIQIYAGKARGQKLVEQTFRQIREVNSNPDFGKIVEQHTAGFIYELKGQGEDRYSFRYVHLVRDTEVVFTTALNQRFSLEEVRRMYEAVKQEP
ncbi:MAG TPA: hypothetical protein PLC89_02835 [Haliscomenobacter sp.]|uniref:hypothetical protein n=1 Tax=Haliscomenobacter sp. TaxID=2717303 RepID=UPI001DB4DCD7|nr:hypothetical protein [Haliscomenobacter sp.]MBK9487376.1 hypothetical protein [Haliscomenobacter sp.]HOY16194.1 hypothetical protein [Haliscomenobacter sp.]HPH17990.1 hypothetical protein [Haliscomenobacter sp.]